VEQTREEIFAGTIIGATTETLFPINYSLAAEETMAQCETEGKGLWCSGIAFLYYKKLKELNFEAYVLSVGFPGEFTHASVLVKIGNYFTLQDPYLNFSLLGDFILVLRNLRKKIFPEIKQGANIVRRVSIAGPVQNYRGWAQKIIHQKPQTKVKSNTIVFSETSLETFSLYYRHEGLQKAFLRLEEFGFEKNILYFYLFPFAVYGPDGYITDKESPLYQKIFQQLDQAIGMFPRQS